VRKEIFFYVTLCPLRLCGAINALNKMTSKQTIQLNSQVTMHFKLTLEDGTLVDRTEKNEPLVFSMEDDTFIEGLKYALLDLKAGDKETMKIPPETGFGFRDPEAIHHIPLADFPDDIEPKPGRIIGFHTPDGEEIPGAVLSIEGDQIKVDFNHPCAGHEVTFQVEILSVENPAE